MGLYSSFGRILINVRVIDSSYFFDIIKNNTSGNPVFGVGHHVHNSVWDTMLIVASTSTSAVFIDFDCYLLPHFVFYLQFSFIL